jgi:hypothetical protein
MDRRRAVRAVRDAEEAPEKSHGQEARTTLIKSHAEIQAEQVQAEVVPLTSMGRAFLEGFSSGEGDSLTEWPAELCGAIKQALCTIDQQERQLRWFTEHSDYVITQGRGEYVDTIRGAMLKAAMSTCDSEKV